MGSISRIARLNERELEGNIPPEASWHADYRDTAWVFIGGLHQDLSEGDIITIFSQFGEPVRVELARDKQTGKGRGFAFLKYEDQRSTDLAVDNLSGATVLGRKLAVDHKRFQEREVKEDTREDDKDRDRDHDKIRDRDRPSRHAIEDRESRHRFTHESPRRRT